MIPLEDRTRLIQLLETQIPATRQQPLRSFLSLMLTLLSEYDALETLAREKVQAVSILAADLKKISSRLRQQAESRGWNPVPPQVPGR